MIWLFASLAFAQEPPETSADTPADPAETPAEAPAADATDMERAATLFENGARLYDEALYDQAIEAFNASYELSGQHALLYNIANAQERAGDLEGTITTLNKYRIYASADEQAVLDRRVRTLENRLDEQRAQQAALLAAQAKPTAPTTVMQTNTTKWIVTGSGLATAGVFGALAGVSYANGVDASNIGDKDTYTGARTLNNVSIGLAGLGLGLAAVGLAMPSKREVPVVSVDVRKGGTHVGMTWTY